MSDIFSDLAVQSIEGEAGATGIRPLMQPLFASIPASALETLPVPLFHISSVVTPALVLAQPDSGAFDIPEGPQSEPFFFDPVPSRFLHTVPPVEPLSQTIASGLLLPEAHPPQQEMPSPIMRAQNKGQASEDTQQELFALSTQLSARRSDELRFNQTLAGDHLTEELVHEQDGMLPRVRAFSANAIGQKTQGGRVEHVEQPISIDGQRTRAGDGFMHSIGDASFHSVHGSSSELDPLTPLSQQPDVGQRGQGARTSAPLSAGQGERVFGARGAGRRTDRTTAPADDGTNSRKPPYVSGGEAPGEAVSNKALQVSRREVPQRDVSISLMPAERQTEVSSVVSPSPGSPAREPSLPVISELLRGKNGTPSRAESAPWGDTEISGRGGEAATQRRSVRSDSTISLNTGEETQFTPPERRVAGEAEETIIRVNIGHLVVRAAPPPSPAPSSRRGPRPALSLSEYLKRRENATR